MKRILALVAAFALPLVAAAQSQPANLVTWREGLQSSAQPSAEWLGQLREKGYELVINLAPPQSHGSIRDEGAIVGAKGVPYVNIPVDFGKPTAEDFRLFSEVMKAAKGKKVFVHCQVNMRGSAFVFLYRVIHEDAPVGDTAIKMNGVWAPDRVWKQFIDDTLAASGRKAEVY